MHPATPEGEDIVTRARQLPLERRQVPFLLSDSALRRSSLWAYQKAAKSMSAKKGSASRTISGDDLMITGSRQATTVKIEPSALTHTRKTRGGGVVTRASHQSAEIERSAGNLAAALSNLNLNVFPHDGFCIFLSPGTVLGIFCVPQPLRISVLLMLGDHRVLLTKTLNASVKRVVTFIHWSEQVWRSAAWLRVSILCLLRTLF
ncbi:hypothetical protein Bca4012_083866 [Brassica carinata]|uniref:Uncharacterized protein n=1 Tax=Brassica carinata TaxID=52824 RepID=A0A8X7SHF2_BRACI|nr:hypothetical protein Bca52824_026911 [Brassica carinata]